MVRSLILLVAILIFGCDNKQSYHFNGKVINGNFDHSKIYLSSTLQTLDYPIEIIDTSEVINGTFTFRGEMNSPQPYLITGTFPDGKRLYELMFADGSEQKLVFDAIQNDVIAYDTSSYDILKSKFYNHFPKLNTFEIYAEIDSARLNSNLAKMDSLQQIIDKSELEVQKYILKFIESNPNSPVSTYILAELNNDLEQSQLVKAFQLLSGNAVKSPFYTYLNNNIEKIAQTSYGQKAPNLILPDLEGKIKKLNDYKDNYVVLDFWALWCGPCREENRNVLAPLYEKYSAENFEIFSVSMDKKSEGMSKRIQQGIIRDNISWATVWDEKAFSGQSVEKYYITKLPTTLLLDKDQRIIGLDVRGDSLKKRMVEIFGY